MNEELIGSAWAGLTGTFEKQAFHGSGIVVRGYGSKVGTRQEMVREDQNREKMPEFAESYI